MDLSYRDECFDQIGLKPSEKIALYNGALECQFRKYQLFDGKYKAFRKEIEGKEFKSRRDDARPRRTSDRGESKRRFEEKREADKRFENKRGERRFEGKREGRRFERKREEGKRFERKRENRRFEGKKDFKE